MIMFIDQLKNIISPIGEITLSFNNHENGENETFNSLNNNGSNKDYDGDSNKRGQEVKNNYHFIREDWSFIYIFIFSKIINFCPL